MLFRSLEHLECDDLQVALLEPSDDFTDQTLLHAVGLNQIQQEEAKSRLAGIADQEFHWQSEIHRLTARAANLKLESEMASHSIARQDAFGRQLSAIQSELAPVEIAP